MSYFKDALNDSIHYLHNSKETSKELRVYGVNSEKINNWSELACNDISEISDNDWISIAEEQGFVWSVTGFANYYNNLCKGGDGSLSIRIF